jgi:hypothetical protein
MQAEPSKADQPKRNRHRFQFRLRTLMIAVTLLAVPCAYVGWQARRFVNHSSLSSAVVPDPGNCVEMVWKVELR